jgi:hypothetical protein
MHATLVYNASNTHIDYTVLPGEVSATDYGTFTMYMYALHVLQAVLMIAVAVVHQYHQQQSQKKVSTVKMATM